MGPSRKGSRFEMGLEPWVLKCWEPSLWLNLDFWQPRGFCSDDEVFLIQQIFMESFLCLRYYPGPGTRPAVPRQTEPPAASGL